MLKVQLTLQHFHLRIKVVNGVADDHVGKVAVARPRSLIGDVAAVLPIRSIDPAEVQLCHTRAVLRLRGLGVRGHFQKLEHVPIRLQFEIDLLHLDVIDGRSGNSLRVDADRNAFPHFDQRVAQASGEHAVATLQLRRLFLKYIEQWLRLVQGSWLVDVDRIVDATILRYVQVPVQSVTQW